MDILIPQLIAHPNVFLNTGPGFEETSDTGRQILESLQDFVQTDGTDLGSGIDTFLDSCRGEGVRSLAESLHKYGARPELQRADLVTEFLMSPRVAQRFAPNAHSVYDAFFSTTVGKERMTHITRHPLAISSQLLFALDRQDKVFSILNGQGKLVALLRWPKDKEKIFVTTLPTGQVQISIHKPSGDPLILERDFGQNDHPPRISRQSKSAVGVARYNAEQKVFVAKNSEGISLKRDDLIALGDQLFLVVGLPDKYSVFPSLQKIEVRQGQGLVRQAGHTPDKAVATRVQRRTDIISGGIATLLTLSYSPENLARLVDILEAANCEGKKEFSTELLLRAEARLAIWQEEAKRPNRKEEIVEAKAVAAKPETSEQPSSQITAAMIHEARHATGIVVDGDYYGIGENGLLKMGRNRANDLITDSPEVSSRHAEISRDADGIFYLRDLGSTNGTRLNSQRLIPHITYPIPPNATLQFGALSVPFRFGYPRDDPDATRLQKWISRGERWFSARHPS